MKTIKSYQKVKNFRESTLQKPTKPYKNPTKTYKTLQRNLQNPTKK